MKKRGLSLGSILTILLTVAVLAGSIAVYSAFHSDADVQMRTLKMAGLLSDTFGGNTQEPDVGNVNVTTVTLSPQTQQTPPPQPVATLPPATDGEVTITLAGLASFESSVSDSVYNKQTASCEYQPILSGLAGPNTGDIRIVALSQGLCANEKQYTDTNAQNTAAMALRAAGFDTVMLDADAVLQMGANAAETTADALYQNGLLPCGLNTGRAAQMQWVEKDGMKIALIAYQEKMSTKSANTLQSTGGQGMLAADTMDELKAMITDARSRGAHLVIVYYYWQQTSVTKVTANMRKTALDVTAAGADVIVGVGPKRLLPAAWLSTSDDNGISRRALVLYSLGSLLTESREGYDISGALVHVKVKAKGSGAQATALSYTPTYIWKQQIGGKDQYRVLQSNAAAPNEMNEAQRGVMSRCLLRTRENLDDSLLLINED